MGASSYTNDSNFSNVLPAMPFRKSRELVGAHEKIKLRARLLGLQRFKRVDGERGAGAPKFAVIDHGMRHGVKCQPRHRQPVIGGRQSAHLVPRLPCRNDVERIKTELPDGGVRECDMGIVWGIKGAAEDADSSSSGAGLPIRRRIGWIQIQSRFTRKSE